MVTNVAETTGKSFKRLEQLKRFKRLLGKVQPVG
ncbi:phosphoribosylaminoimidazole synthetase [Candidatus Brocadia sinica JPN1]|uniref:Phosphoribosylaminoimidazole synthetase n=1 Tax=Candidatus Brocadia sinica JPN1 TaxID=1197129 RepID=A0ABQ0JZT3_9BACT|nr:phosphoribosylaminoimidazole synthetase [Candidatus Brocadia sinica JPN1]